MATLADAALALRAPALLAALALDWWLGEPPARMHPVVWMGTYLNAAGRRIAPAAGAPASCAARFVAGALAWIAGAAVTVLAGWCLQRALAAAPLAWQIALTGVLLKPLLAWRMLRDEVAAVEAALARSLDEGRARLAMIVSRDVSALDETQVRESAIEALAENLNDSVVAPLLWFALLGLPGAAAYRFANTADAMWGYRGERGGRDWTWAGKWAARADDALSWIPARVTGWLLAAGAAAPSWSALRAEAARTPSPNSGWPMAAMAMRLNVRLRKPGAYVLWPQGRRPTVADTRAALRRAQAVISLVAAAAAGASVLAVLEALAR